MYQHLETILAERVFDAREEQARDPGGVVRLYADSWKKCITCIEQLVHDPFRTGRVQVEKPAVESAGANNTLPTCPNESEFDACAGHSFA